MARILAGIHADQLGPVEPQTDAALRQLCINVAPFFNARHSRLDALTTLLRSMPSEAHRRVLSGEYETFSWETWPVETLMLAVRAGQTINDPSDFALAMHLIEDHLAAHEPTGTLDDLLQEVSHFGRGLRNPETTRLALYHTLREMHGTYIRPSQEQGVLREGWADNENVMRQPRRNALNASLHALLQATPLDQVPGYDAFTGAEYSNPVVHQVVQHLRNTSVPFELSAPRTRVPLWDVLRLVLHSIDTYRHPSGDAQCTATDQANMRVALGNNLASSIEMRQGVPVVVCFVGLCERMVRALHGYDPRVQVVFVSPQELVNGLAAELQRTRTGPLDDAAAQGFVDRCMRVARDYFGDDPAQIDSTATLAQQAAGYLRQ